MASFRVMDYYDAIAPGYDELHGEEQRTKLRFIEERIRMPENANILDVGCGTGISTAFWGAATGVDPSEGLLAIAQEKYPTCRFIQASAEKLPFANNIFDVIVSLTALQNFQDIPAGIKEIIRVGSNYILTYRKKSPRSREIEEALDDLKCARFDQGTDIIFISKDILYIEKNKN